MRPSLISTTSAQAASTQPPAIACPFTAATSGTGSVNAVRNMSVSAGSSRRGYSAPPPTTLRRSTPAENARPAPVSTTARTPSTCGPRRPSATAVHSSTSSAFTGGRASVSTAIPSTSAHSITVRQ